MKSAVVTGAGSGIGRACVERFASKGWQVLAIDLTHVQPMDDERVSSVVCDVTADEQIAEVIGAFARRVGGIDALVNNAAVQLTGDTLGATAEEWRRTLDVNVRGIAVMVGACRPWLAEKKGGVVNVSSVHAKATSPEIGVYAASKGAVSALTRALAVELAPEGIRVNAVLPGAVDTPMLRAGFSRSDSDVMTATEGLAARTVMGRLGAPDEIARAIHFLAESEASSFTTGSELVVDGGASARLSTE